MGNVSDIVNHEFADSRWSLNTLEPEDGEVLNIYEHETCTDDGEANEIEIHREDAIAIAKHFGLIK